MQIVLLKKTFSAYGDKFSFKYGEKCWFKLTNRTIKMYNFADIAELIISWQHEYNVFLEKKKRVDIEDENIRK